MLPSIGRFGRGAEGRGVRDEPGGRTGSTGRDESEAVGASPTASGTNSTGRLVGEGKRPRTSAAKTVAQRCLQGSPSGPKYGHVHDAKRRVPRSRKRTLYAAVPRTFAKTSPGRVRKRPTRPLSK